MGAAYGPVLTRLGDVYSPVVNLASRLTSIARPSSVLVDRELARRLLGSPAYRVRPLRQVSVRGYDQLQPLAGPPPRGRRPAPAWPRWRSCSTRSPRDVLGRGTDEP
ncbi:adenylate/guanylate cyclase domain-containing protein, partial [Modestobacter sp. VKM Ac-2676]